MCRLTLAAALAVLAAAGCDGPAAPKKEGPKQQQKEQAKKEAPKKEAPKKEAPKKVEPERRKYETAKGLEQYLKGKSREEVVALIGKPIDSLKGTELLWGPGKSPDSPGEPRNGRRYERWLYNNGWNEHFRIEDPVTGLGPVHVIVTFFDGKGVAEVSTNEHDWR